MSITKDENWEFLSRQHEQFLKDPGYLAWLEYSTRPIPLTPEEEKKWQEMLKKIEERM